MLKKAVCTVLVSLILLFAAAPASAAIAPEPQIALSESENAATRAEQFEWVFRRTSDGKIQKRKWSITYGYWVTDWIDCN